MSSSLPVTFTASLSPKNAQRTATLSQTHTYNAPPSYFSAPADSFQKKSDPNALLFSGPHKKKQGKEIAGDYYLAGGNKSDESLTSMGQNYMTTGRSADGLLYKTVYPDSAYQDLEQGMKVADLGCGESAKWGAWLQKQKGVNSYNFDRQATGENIITTDISKLDRNAYAEKFDVIYSSWGPFTYPDESHEKRLKMLENAAAWLKPGGKLRFSPVNDALRDSKNCNMRDLVRMVPGLQITHEEFMRYPVSQSNGTWGVAEKVLYMEITKQASPPEHNPLEGFQHLSIGGSSGGTYPKGEHSTLGSGGYGSHSYSYSASAPTQTGETGSSSSDGYYRSDWHKCSRESGEKQYWVRNHYQYPNGTIDYTHAEYTDQNPKRKSKR